MMFTIHTQVPFWGTTDAKISIIQTGFYIICTLYHTHIRYNLDVELREYASQTNQIFWLPCAKWPAKWSHD
jgi:hypothetical protein